MVRAESVGSTLSKGAIEAEILVGFKEDKEDWGIYPGATDSNGKVRFQLVSDRQGRDRYVGSHVR